MSVTHIINVLSNYGNCLANLTDVTLVSLCSGFVHLYHVSSLRDWEELDLGHADSVLKFDAEHINALELGENDSGPVVIVATESQVTLVQWQTFTNCKDAGEATLGQPPYGRDLRPVETT